jgi:hypothetical protein
MKFFFPLWDPVIIFWQNFVIFLPKTWDLKKHSSVTSTNFWYHKIEEKKSWLWRYIHSKKVLKIGPRQHQNSYFPEKVPSRRKCNMAAQVRTENVTDWKKQYIVGMVMRLQLNGNQYSIKSFPPQMWIFALLWWRPAEAFHLIFWLNLLLCCLVMEIWLVLLQFILYNYLWKQPILRFSTQIPQTSMKCYAVQLAWREKSYGLTISINSCTCEVKDFKWNLLPWWQEPRVTQEKKTTLQGSSRPWRNNKNEQARSYTWVEENAKQNVEPWILKDLLSLKTLHGLSTTEMLVILPSKPTKE